MCLPGSRILSKDIAVYGVDQFVANINALHVFLPLRLLAVLK